MIILQINKSQQMNEKVSIIIGYTICRIGSEPYKDQVTILGRIPHSVPYLSEKFGNSCQSDAVVDI